MIELDAKGKAAAGGVLEGTQMQPRDIAAELYAAGPSWMDALVLMEGVMVVLGESQGWTRAFNDNTAQIGDVDAGAKVRNAETLELYEIVSKTATTVTVFDSSGSSTVLPREALVVVSRDAGIMQINVAAALIGTPTELDLYDVEANVRAGYALYVVRGWQPWVAWNTRVCFRDTYVKRAARGVGNFLGHYALVQPPDAAAKPRYLADPILDYTYRLGGALHYLGKAKTDLIALKKSVTTPANRDRIDAIVSGDVGAGLGFKTADHPWDYGT